MPFAGDGETELDQLTESHKGQEWTKMDMTVFISLKLLYFYGTPCLGVGM